MDYYRDTVTEKSWTTLKALTQKYSFALIGGWAVWLWTKQLKSKDIDIIIDLPGLTKLREKFELTKNDRLKKYEAIDGPVQIDIYVPYWSVIGIPAEDLLKLKTIREGFQVIIPEALLFTKHVAYQARKGSVKGRKDLIDIISLLLFQEIDLKKYHDLTIRYDVNTTLQPLSALINSQISIPELNLNLHEYAKLKKRWLSKFTTF